MNKYQLTIKTRRQAEDIACALGPIVGQYYMSGYLIRRMTEKAAVEALKRV